MKNVLQLSALLISFGFNPLKADTFDARAVLGMSAGVSVDAAVKRGKAAI